MLGVLKEKAIKAGFLEVKTHLGEFKSMELPNSEYSGAYCFHDTFGEIVQSYADCEVFFSKMRKLVREGGWILVQMSNPRIGFRDWKMVIGGDSEDGNVRAEEHFFVDEPDEMTGLMKFRDIIKIYEKGELKHEHQLKYSVRYWSAEELRILFLKFGLTDVRVIGEEMGLSDTGGQTKSFGSFAVLGRFSK